MRQGISACNYGKVVWKQPNEDAISIDDKRAAMTIETFNELREHTWQIPRKEYVGKIWKEYAYGNWYLRWMCLSEDGKRRIVETRPIVIASNA